MKIYDCSNSVERPLNRKYGGSVENAVVSMLKKYGALSSVEFVNNPEKCDLLFTNDVFPEEVLNLNKPKVKRMDGIFWQEQFADRNEPLNRAAKQADHVIFISEFSKNTLASLYGFLPNEYSVVTNWIDEEMFYPLSLKIEKPKRFVAVATSWGREEKRLNDTLAFASEVLDGQLFLVGNLPDIKLPSNVISLGYVEYKELGSVLRQMDALVNLSYRDPAPKVVPEAICCGLPVLYADSGGTSEMAKDYGVGIPENKSICFGKNTPRLDIWDIKTSYLKLIDNYSSFRSTCFKKRNMKERLLTNYYSVFERAIWKHLDKTNKSDRERFRDFLDRSDSIKNKYEPWELTLLGGFGGYNRVKR